ncbi:MAG: 2Fe-2S iron-sulfur cluster-binding protein [Cloacibacillus porcorum]|uniref:(2Fe-2S)-binding protein n=1 Tax=Cloacibacillus porcorum TaxID=1197717 RepID=UPI0023F059FB|nr:2Fe-2S iron-sulfur cluster-binding protein [Cloacibacillus porcorum]MCD7878074.1 2Fe-2S iron-sulfur cluster-binding protein [Cloacibacillus porcorum]
MQQAFYDAGSVQCGYCIPGMVLSAKALLDKNPAPSSDEIRKALSGNLCRCTGYTKIEEAVKLAAERLGGGAR